MTMWRRIISRNWQGQERDRTKIAEDVRGLLALKQEGEKGESGNPGAPGGPGAMREGME